MQTMPYINKHCNNISKIIVVFLKNVDRHPWHLKINAYGFNNGNVGNTCKEEMVDGENIVSIH